MRLRARDLLSLAELSPREARGLVSQALRMKAERRGGRGGAPLRGRTLAMLFQKPSTRTRASFEAGMAQLGGSAMALSASDTQLSRGETLADTARSLSRYADAIVARVFAHSDLEELAAASSVPVINGLSDSFHPCQTLADLATLRERHGRLEGLRVCWVGDGNNVCNSLLLGCSLVGASVAVATPPRFRPMPRAVAEARRRVGVELTADPAAAARGADAVMTDTFSSMHDRAAGRDRAFLPRYRVTARLMRRAAPGAVFMHCLPAKRGREVEAAVIDGPRSAVWDQAENRLHVQKALLASLLRA